MFVPDNDGIDHINIYSRSRTHLGRALSNWFYVMDGIKTNDGVFHTIEGYWFWLLTEYPHKEFLRTFFGAEAKRLGSEYKREWPKVPPEDFRKRIADALRHKATSLPWLYRQLGDCKLPLAHYYVYGQKVVPAGPGWLTEEWNTIRSEIQQGKL